MVLASSSEPWCTCTAGLNKSSHAAVHGEERNDSDGCQIAVAVASW